MTLRRKKILLIQIFIFLAASVLLYYTYYEKNTNPLLKAEFEKKIQKSNVNENKNTFENIEYKGLDLNGNRYSVNAEKASFIITKPEEINMEIMLVYFYFKDSTVLRIESKSGVYNNQTFDMQFRDQVKAKYEENYLFSDKLNYFSNSGLITISGNILGESIQGDVVADKAVIKIKDKTLNLSMFDENQVNVNLKD